ncbi:MAG TPA: dTDP-4-dehydrorhamnose reductase [Vicinamibacterales bacterium]|nr:dTDP-4-dehydrorhamnose reductase [Vicinamibacterales bacterium]
MRILMTGANGQLGSALRRVLSLEDLTLKDLPEFDLADPASESQIREAKPDIILHVGAYTNVDQAEREPERAYAVNAQGTRRVAQAAQAAKARLIYVSTDYVFDGTKTSPYDEQDTPHPLNHYGRSKYEGEQAVLTLCPNSLVVRTAWLFGHEGPNFVKTIMRVAQERPVLEVVDDQRGCPTYAEDLAQALSQLALSDLRGICHVTNSGHCSWYEFAQAIVRLTGSMATVNPITTAQFGRPAKRPAYSVLSHDRFATQYSPLPEWQDALARFLRHVSHAVSPA